MKKQKNMKKLSDKGLAPVIAGALFLFGVMIFLEGVILTNLSVKTGETIRTVKETEIIKAINNLEAVKKALNDALTYSTYRASKDVFDKGGFCARDDEGSCTGTCKIDNDVPTLGCVPWWRVYDKVYAPNKVEFTQYMKEQISKIFEEYATAFSVNVDYCPTPPGVVTIFDSDQGIYVRMSSIENEQRNRMTYDGDFFDITENSTFSDTIDIKTMKMFDEGRSLFGSGDAIRDAFEDAERKILEECRKVEVGDKCKNEIDCEGRLPGACSRALDAFEDDARANLAMLEKLSDGVKTDVDIAGCFETSRSTEYVYSNKIDEYVGCDCARWTVECEGEASNCAGLGQDACESQDGCTFSMGCSGNPNPCKTYTGDPLDCESYGCIVDEQTGECRGTPGNCGSYGKESLCKGSGCTWDEECIGDASSCDDFDDSCSGANKDNCEDSLTDCKSQSGCSGSMSCERRYDFYENVSCIYNYQGSANVSVEIKDVDNKYPIGGSWEDISLHFYAVSGNGDKSCTSATTKDERCKVS